MFFIRIYYSDGHFDLPFDHQQFTVAEAIRQFRRIWPDQPVQGISAFKREPAARIDLAN